MPKKHSYKRPFTLTQRKERASIRYFLNREKYDAKSLEWKRRNPERARIFATKANYLIRYGITPEEKQIVLNNQNGKCVICKMEISISNKNSAHVDHDHITGKVRGILCLNCNSGLGRFNDNINTLLSAINYLKKRKFILLISPFEKVG